MDAVAVTYQRGTSKWPWLIMSHLKRSLCPGLCLLPLIIHYRHRMPGPTLPVSNISTRPAPNASSSTQRNRIPYSSFHFLVRPGRIPANSPRARFAKWKPLSVSTAPSQRSLSNCKGASSQGDRRSKASKCARPEPSSRRYVPVFGKDKNRVAARAWAFVCTAWSGSEE